jgi:hypothetical protein
LSLSQLSHRRISIPVSISTVLSLDEAVSGVFFANFFFADFD